MRYGLVIYLEEDEVICRDMSQKEDVIYSETYFAQDDLYKYCFYKRLVNIHVRNI